MCALTMRGGEFLFAPFPPVERALGSPWGRTGGLSSTQASELRYCHVLRWLVPFPLLPPSPLRPRPSYTVAIDAPNGEPKRAKLGKEGGGILRVLSCNEQA